MMKMAAALAVAGLLITAYVGPAHAFPGAGPPVQLGTAGSAVPDTDPVGGKVLETMDSGGYTYMLLETVSGERWVAVPKMKVKVGEERAFMPGNIMHDFSSKTLGKTFDTILFSPGPMALPGNPGQAAKDAAEAAPVARKVDKAEGSSAYTVAECYAKSASLDKKTVSVKGRVVKVSKRIMGKNWVHLQDGSGDPAKGTHNLVFTTAELAEVDDIVTATGKLAKDRDFGYGYKYDVIVEDAKITK